MSTLRLVTDGSPADWVASGIGPFGSGVGALVPHGFEAYARILHPASSREGAPVRWDAIARWSGGVAHALAQFEPLARPRSGGGSERAPFDEPPRTGHLIEPLLGALCAILARHTSTADRCCYCLWDGYGWVSGSPSVRLPERDYLLFKGPLDGISEMGWRLDGRFHTPQSPNLFWPHDRAWFVATEIDLDSTFVGGSAALIHEVLGEVRLEAWPSRPADLVWATSDDINKGA
jgi:hypothetical protein